VLGTQLLILICKEFLLQNFGIQTHNGWPELDAWYSIGMLLAGALMASMLPAWRAYRISLSDGLHPPS
jgi:putative ABC transport system permease protein